MGQRLAALVEGLPFGERVSGALLDHSGELGALLAGVLAFERGNFDRCESYGLDLLELSGVYRASLAWVEEAAPHLA